MDSTNLVTSQGWIQDFPGRGRQPIIWPNFPRNCMEMKKLDQKNASKLFYVDPPLQIPNNNLFSICPGKIYDNIQQWILSLQFMGTGGSQ